MRSSFVFDDLYSLDGECLGKGKFAYVFNAKRRYQDDASSLTAETGSKEYAVKIYCRESVDTFGRLIENEINALNELKHPNVISLVDYFYSDLGVYLVFEKLTGGDLASHFLRKYKDGVPYTEKQIRRWCMSLLSAIAHCHKHKIIHRDVKPNNIMVVSDEVDADIKLVDFGLAVQMVAPTVCGTAGTLPYFAPELVSKEPYAFEIDMWAFGVTAFTLLTGRLPFLSTTEAELKAKILRAAFAIDCSLSASAVDFIQRLLVVDRRIRLTAAEALNHVWITSKEEVSNKPLDESASKLTTFFKINRFAKAASWWLAMKRWQKKARARVMERRMNPLENNSNGNNNLGVLLEAAMSMNPTSLDLDLGCTIGSRKFEVLNTGIDYAHQQPKRPKV